MQTSGMVTMRVEAISRAQMMFSRPSERSMPRGSWLPVKMMGLLRFLNMKLRAEAV